MESLTEMEHMNSQGLTHLHQGHKNYCDLTEFDDFINVSLCIDIDVADSLTVTEHRDAFGRPLNIANQLGGTSRYNQVDYLVQAAEILHLFTSAHLATYTTLSKTENYMFSHSFLPLWEPCFTSCTASLTPCMERASWVIWWRTWLVLAASLPPFRRRALPLAIDKADT